MIMNQRYAGIFVSIELHNRHSLCYVSCMIKVFSYRIKDSNSAQHLNGLARAVNVVWNFCGDTQKHALRWALRWPTGYDFNQLTNGVGKELGLHSQTVQAIGQEYATRRKQHRKHLLRFRGKRSLGWIPFKRSGIKVKGDSFIYGGQRFKAWVSRPLDGHIKSGSFSQDARGRWYINIACEITNPIAVHNGKAVGVDLGLKDTAVINDGVNTTRIARQRFYQDLEPSLAEAQRRNDKKRVQRIHAKIANRRKDYLHKASTKLVEQYQFIFIGDVSSTKLARTKMAKSVLDAGWGMLRDFVKYKAIARKSTCNIVNEAHTTVECSVCHERTGPSGQKALNIRQWTCANCNTPHDRDGNASANIRQRGLIRLGLQPVGPTPIESHEF